MPVNRKQDACARDHEDCPQVRNRGNARYRSLGVGEGFCALSGRSRRASRRYHRLQSRRNRRLDFGNQVEARGERRLARLW